MHRKWWGITKERVITPTLEKDGIAAETAARGMKAQAKKRKRLTLKEDYSDTEEEGVEVMLDDISDDEFSKPDTTDTLEVQVEVAKFALVFNQDKGSALYGWDCWERRRILAGWLLPA